MITLWSRCCADHDIQQNGYIITATDAFSKWAYAKPCQTVTTGDITQFLKDEIFSTHRIPEVLITDRGVQFTSREWNVFKTCFKFEHSLMASYHPQANGIDERLNGILIRILSKYVEKFQDNRDKRLKWALFVYNTTIHDSTTYSPYQILHGLDSRSPLKDDPSEVSKELEEIDKVRQFIRENAKCKNIKSQAKQNRDYDTRRSNHDFKIGNLVLTREHNVHRETKLSKNFHPKWNGPHVIIGFVGDEMDPQAIKIIDCETGNA